MSAFDKNEQNIYNALSRITVDTNQLAEQVKSQLHETTPCFAAPRRRRWPVSAVAAVVISAVLVGTAAAAILGGFDWFIEKFNPAFGEIVEPVEISCEDQGIRMEVIGAQKYGNMAIVYLSLQDISGQNRLTEQTNFNDGFSVRTISQTQEATGRVDEVVSSGFSWKQKMLYLEEETNTIYYEFNITVDSDSPLSAPFELGSSLIYFDEKDYKNEPISLSLSGVREAEAISIGEDQVWGGTTNVADDLVGPKMILAPGNYAPMPHGEDDQWISNIGIVDGKLHVQIGKVWNEEFGSSDASLSLMTSDGELIGADYKLMLLSDEDDHLLDPDENDYGDAVYKYEESVFPVSTEDLGTYTLCYTGSVYSGVEGKWNVTVNLSDTSQQMRIRTNNIPIEGYLFEHMTLSPLGLQVIGSYEEDEYMVGEMSLEVETADGVIPLEYGGGSYNGQEQTFNLHWNTKTPLDVTTVTAIIINGTRILVK